MDNSERTSIWEHSETCFEQYQNYLTTKIIDIIINNNNNNHHHYNVENLLKNHININTITEITGATGSGKTQLCFYLSIITQLSIRDSNNSFINTNEIFYINTNRNFTPRRINEMVERIAAKTNLKNYKIEDFTTRIHVIDINNIDELFSIIVLLRHWLEDRQVKLLIIDSISYIVKQCNFIERTGLIYSILQKLRELARKFKFAIILTNDFTTKITKNGKSELLPCFGDSFHHSINTRLLLEQNKRKFLINLEKNISTEHQTIAWDF